MIKTWHSNQLYLYLLKSVIFFHILFTSLFIFVVLLSNVWYFAPEWLELGIALKHIFVMVLFFIPGALLQATAISLSVAFWVAYGKLQFYKEIDAMRSLGLSSYQMFKPVFHYAIFVSIALLLITYVLYPYSMHKFQDYYSHVLTQFVAVKAQSSEPQVLGDTVVFIENLEEEQHWVIIERRQGQKIVVWANDTSLMTSEDVRTLKAKKIEILAVDIDSNSKQWHWAQAIQLDYPLLFNINTQSYNPYDTLPITRLWRSAQILLRLHYEKIAQQQDRVKELRRMLLMEDVSDRDREIYKEEILTAKKSLKFSPDLISLFFIVILRISHILLIIALAMLAFLLLELHEMHRWTLAIIIWFIFVTLYWLSFYFVSSKVLSLQWNIFILFVSVGFIFLVNMGLIGVIFYKKRESLWKK